MSTQIVNWHAVVFEAMLRPELRERADWLKLLVDVRADASASVQSRGPDGALACPFDDRVEIQRIIGRINHLLS